MEDINRKTMALLVMDVQGATVTMLKENSGQFLDGLAKTVEAARNKNIRVIYVVVGFRKGYPEVSPANKGFTILKTSGRNFDTEDATKVDRRVAPRADDIVVVKKRISAFAGSDLEVVLRANSIQHIVLTGIATSGVVLS
ncbi:MAG TPA: isochorismatase family cysteine hydrolase, partial [Chitinophagaceae bacterium]